MADKKPNVVFVVHPVPHALKAEFKAKGKKIIDARFAPEGADVYDDHIAKASEDKAPEVKAPEVKAPEVKAPEVKK